VLVANIRNVFAWLWLLVVLGCLGTTLYMAHERPLLQTGIIDFLPDPGYPASVHPLIKRYEARNSRKLVYLLESGDATALTAALIRLETLAESESWSLHGGMQPGRGSNATAATWSWWKRYGGSLLSAEDRQTLHSGQYDKIVRQFIMELLSPVAVASAISDRDPFFFLRNFLLSHDAGSRVSVRPDGRSLLVKDHQFAGMLVFEAKQDVFNIDVNERLMAPLVTLEQGLAAAFPEVSVFKAGAVLHVNSGVNSAKREVFIVGLGSLLAILLLFLLAFRSTLPFFLSSLVLASGLLVGFTLTLLLFGSVHVLSFVFCSTVIGLGIDYCLHYFVQRSVSEHSRQALSRVAMPTLMGMLSSVVAFSVLALLPFPGFRQMAIMTALSLLFVWVSLYLWLPALDKWVPRLNTGSLLTLSSHLLVTLRISVMPKVALVLGGLLILLLMYMAIQVSPQDDIRSLQVPEEEILQGEARIYSWLGYQPDTAYFLVTGENEQALLEATELLCTDLYSEHYLALAQSRCLVDWLPSAATQHENKQLLTEFAAAGDGLWQPLEELGLSPEVIARYRQRLREPAAVLTPAEFFKGSSVRAFENLWLGADEQATWGLVVPMAAVQDRAQLAALVQRHPGVYWIDSVSKINGMLKHFRQNSLLYLLLSYAVVVIALLWRYGVARSHNLYLPILAGALMVCAAAGAGLVTFNLFVVMALILVAGMGVDYGIFFIESPSERVTTFAAVLVSGVTTLIAFGLLSLSSTEAIRSFGLTILIGMTTVLLSILLLESKDKT